MARFEIVGRLPGTLTADREVFLHNVSRTGVLIETVAPLRLDSTLNLTVESDRHLATLRARVCHVRRTHPHEGYLVGLEFVDTDADDLEHVIGRFVADYVPRP